MNKKSKALKESINIHYLRPDNALWVYSLYKTVNEYVKKYTHKKYKTLDMGCGDGTTSFLLTGGEIDKKFDVYLGTKFKNSNLAPRMDRSISGSLRDTKGDIYDHYSKLYEKYCRPKKLKNKFTYGMDWKNSLLRKAELLNFYEKLILKDCNKLPLNFKDNSLDMVFSTIVYWLNDPKKIFPEINRILKKGGYFIFTAPKEDIPKLTVKSFLNKFKFKFTDRLDRGRHANWSRHAKKDSFWKNQIKKNNLQLVKIKKLHPKLQIILGESIIRTLITAFGVLYEDLLPKSQKTFFKFKDQYVKELYEILKPFADDKYYNKLDMAYNVYIVKKK